MKPMSQITRIVLDNFLSFGHMELNLSDRQGNPKAYALIYGENGSGKTNLMESLVFLKRSTDTIIDADRIDEMRARLEGSPPVPQSESQVQREAELVNYHVGLMTVGLGALSLTSMAKRYRTIGSSGEMGLGFEFTTAGNRMRYVMRFSEDGSLVCEELSRYTRGSRTSSCFAVESKGGKTEIRFGKSMFKAELSRVLKRRIGVAWGKNSVMAILRSELSRNNPGFMKDSISEPVIDAISFIENIIVSLSTDIPVWDSEWPFPVCNGVMSPSRKGELDAYGRALSSYLNRLYSDIKGAFYETEEDGGRLRYRLMVEKLIFGERRTVPADLESNGTLKLIGMLPALLKCASGGTAFVDEFDSGVHDRMVHDILDQILPGIRGQLVITTHNTLLLEAADPDRVYVIRIDPNGFKDISTFKSLVPTKKGHHNNRQRYLNGLFDGVPIIRELDLDLIAERLNSDLGGKV